MDDLYVKQKREKRIEQKSRHIKRQLKIAKAHNMVTSEPHRYAKHNAMDCGNPDCPMCGNPRHSGYSKQKRTIQELKFFESGKIDTD